MDGKQNFRRALCAPLLFSCFYASATPASVLIAEVYYDAPSSDAGKVFVELAGPAGTDLGGYELRGINGNDGSTYKTVGLIGVIPADGIFVVADESGGSTSVANADQLADVDLQNGPDSIRLFQGTMLLDALGYGSFGAGDFFAGKGSAAPDVSGGSLARLTLQDSGDNAADFAVLDTPTPGVGPVSSVPLPGAFYLMGSGLAMLGMRLRRR